MKNDNSKKKEITRNASPTPKKANSSNATVIHAEVVTDNKNENSLAIEEVGTDAILKHGEKLVEAKKRINFFDEKLKALNDFKSTFDEFKEREQDEIFDSSTKHDNKFNFELSLNQTGGGDYGKDISLLSIKNPHVIDVFVSDVKDYIERKKKETVEQIHQFNKDFANKVR